MTSPSLDDLIAEYLDLSHQGKNPTPIQFAQNFPDYEDELLDTLPLLCDLEEMGETIHTQAQPAPHELPELPQTDFQLLRKIGGGGMGVVYEARQVSLDRLVAVKVLASSLVTNAKWRQNFEHEARVVATLDHPGIVRVIASGVCGHDCYYAMELVRGTKLDYRTKRSLREIAQIGLQAAQALAYAHAHQVMHRDIKPSNLILDAQGQLHIADFGLARILEAGYDAAVTQNGRRNGTLRYMPQERLTQGVSSFAGDQYALGATLYELITQAPLFTEKTDMALFPRICSRPVNPLSCGDKDLDAIINKSISFKPGDRYASMQDFADDLQRYLAHEPVKAASISLVRRFFLWIRREPLFSSFAILCGILGLVIVWMLWSQNNQTRQTLQEIHAKEVEARHWAHMSQETLMRIFKRLEGEAPSPRDTQLLLDLMPYFEEFTQRKNASPETRAEVHRILGTCAYRTGNYALAERAFNQLNEDVATAHDQNLLARTLAHLGRTEEAQARARTVVHIAQDAHDPKERFEGVKALLFLAQKSPHDPDRLRAFEWVSALLKEDLTNPDYRAIYALILGTAPQPFSGKPLPRLTSSPITILLRLTDEHPEHADYLLALVHVMNARLTSLNLSERVDRDELKASIERADRLIARFPNMPEAVQSAFLLRQNYATFLRRSGDPREAHLVEVRTTGMKELFSNVSKLSY